MARSNALVADPSTPQIRPGIDGERCDRCCAAAVVHVVLRSGLDLVFCGHHAHQHELELLRSEALLRVEGRVPSLFT